MLNSAPQSPKTSIVMRWCSNPYALSRIFLPSRSAMEEQEWRGLWAFVRAQINCNKSSGKSNSRQGNSAKSIHSFCHNTLSTLQLQTFQQMLSFHSVLESRQLQEKLQMAVALAIILQYHHHHHLALRLCHWTFWARWKVSLRKAEILLEMVAALHFPLVWLLAEKYVKLIVLCRTL